MPPVVGRCLPVCNGRPLRRIDEMQPGTIGFEAIGEVEDDDWEEQAGRARAAALGGDGET